MRYATMNGNESKSFNEPSREQKSCRLSMQDDDLINYGEAKISLNQTHDIGSLLKAEEQERLDKLVRLNRS